MLSIILWFWSEPAPGIEWNEIEWEQLMSVVAIVGTAVGTLRAWRREKQKELEAREKELEVHTRELEDRRERELAEERRRAALYTMPFMVAAEAMQSRIYNILELGGLGPLREAYPQGEHADETLFLVAQYFGWERCMTRYTRYAYDEDFMEKILALRQLFATHHFGTGMRFFANDQSDLGRLALDRYAGEYGPEFDTVGERAFTLALREDSVLHTATQRAIEPLRVAQTVDDIDEQTHVRMAKLQHLLCDLLEWLEPQHGVRIFRGGGGTRWRAKIPGEASENADPSA